MCSIFGAIGNHAAPVDQAILRAISERARDRGRDGGRVEGYDLSHGRTAFLGNWRAAPTTEAQFTDFQPYDRVVHNGTIANDAELGNEPGAVDSKVLPKVLARSSLPNFAKSLQRVKGSYALAAVNNCTIYLAANYKPLHFLNVNGGLYFASMERHLAEVTPYGHRPARVMPYTAMDLWTGETVSLRREKSNKALVICSGGLDSTTAAYMLKAQGKEVTLLHFTYGCRAEQTEVERVRRIGVHLGAHVAVLPIDYSQFKGASPLLTGGKIAGGIAGAEFAHEWVPARNLLMIAMAAAYAEANGFGTIALGTNLEEAGAYPDNEEQFTTLLDAALDHAVHDGGNVRLVAPLGGLMKHEIAAAGVKLGVPYSLTWSCYRNGERHCGQCGPCYMRKAAFERNGLRDPAF